MGWMHLIILGQHLPDMFNGSGFREGNPHLQGIHYMCLLAAVKLLDTGHSSPMLA